MFRTILLADDHAAILEGLRTLMLARYSSADCRSAPSLSEALRLLRGFTPEIAIVDLSIGDASGLELVSAIRELSSRARILVYTMHPESQFGAHAIRAGADGYLTKDRPMTEFVEALTWLEAGRRYISAALGESLANAVVGGDSRALSAREMQVLRLIAAGRAPKEIAAELGVSIKTVSTYRTRILEKLGLGSTADLVRYAIARNW